ncbi:MAG: PKD domain-containing protein [Candidatus Peribacteria bacterium]|nr:PKD domain-containing protein [Candidatus Peribacteria bacterium]
MVNFNAIVYPNDNSLSYSWDFGDGSSGI